MMETTVQSFVQNEVANLLVDEDALNEWKELKDELGLDAQNSLAQDDKSPIPYLWLNTNMKNIVEELCPISRDVSEYSKTPIPLDVLKIVKTCKTEKYFDRIQIWYTDIEPDPVCVGLLSSAFYPYGDEEIDGVKFGSYKTVSKRDIKKGLWNKLIKKSGTLTSEYYLLARWGDMARSFEDLKKMAIEKFTKRTTEEKKEQIRQAQRELEDIESNALKQFG
jgi:hypothetical protein